VVWQVSECNGRSDGCYVENRKVSTWPGTENSVANLLAEYLPFNSAERTKMRCNSQRQVVADCCYSLTKVNRERGKAANVFAKGITIRLPLIPADSDAYLSPDLKAEALWKVQVILKGTSINCV
jgi:hypothetical protein